MSLQYPGGLITKSPVTPSGPYETSTASGVWTLDEQAYWNKLGQWPTAGNVPKDAQFNYVTMLLHGDGTNGAQNNTFLDSSTNNFTITRNGNTTQGSFSPYGSNWSNYFGGTGNYLTTATSASAFSFGTGDFTIEFWINSTQTTRCDPIGQNNTFSSSGWWGLIGNLSSSGQLQWFENTTSRISATATNWNNGSWNHIAVTRSGNSVRMFVNGTQVGSTYTTSFTYGASSVGVIAGVLSDDKTTGPLTGYMSNFRIVKGTALYTSTFTPSTTPLTAVSGTSLLTCQANRFFDASTNALTITTTGTPSVQRFNPFGASTAYSTSVIGGSGYFDGSGDYLTTSSGSGLAVGTGDYTIDCWVYATSTPSDKGIYEGRDSGGSNGITITAFTGTSIRIFAGSALVTASNVNYVGCWCHVAVARVSGTTSLYINGVSAGSSATSYDGTRQTAIIGAGIYSGGSPNAFFPGYISDFRLIKGTAIYTGNFTPPTAPVTAITNTQLLTSTTNGAIFDNAMMNDLETVGNAQISTSVVKYGTGSLAFDGTNNCCLTTQSAMSSSAPFTFECWAYWNDTGTSTDMGMLCSQYASGQSGRMLFGSQSGALVLRVDGGTVYLTTSVSTGTWYFVAWTFDGTTHRLFLNGTLASSSTSVPALYTGVNTSIGGQPETLLADYCLDGYMDEVRITNGYARYTTTFTPPTQAFSNIGPT